MTPASLNPLLRLPPSGAGQAIGLFGGSFDPPHEGHRHVCLSALRRLNLDAIWWIVTPGNPLKDMRGRRGLDERLAHVARFVRHPRFRVTGFEAAYGLRYTAETLAHLVSRCPDRRFVWLMGADNLDGFHLWRDWRTILETMPVAVIDRPGADYSEINARAALAFAHARVDESDAAGLARMQAPAWTFLHGPLNDLSSTRLRAKRAEQADPEGATPLPS